MGDIPLGGNFDDGRTYVFDSNVLESAAAVIRQRITGNPGAVVEAFRTAIVPESAWGLIPNADRIVHALTDYVTDLAAVASRAPGLAADLASRALAASELVAKADADTSHAAGQTA